MGQEKLKILIVDDDVADRQYLIHTLNKTSLDFEHKETSNVEEALKILQKGHFDCAFLDYYMPGINGIRGIQEIKKISPYTAAIMLTGRGDELIASLGMKAGASDYIPKEYLEPASLQFIIEKAVEKGNLTKALDEQRAELENFSKVLVHDLKSPFVSIEQLVQTIENDMASESYEKLPDKLKALKWAVNHASLLIQTLYEYTQAERDLNLEKVDFNDLFQLVKKNLEPEINKKHADIICSQSLPTVAVDKTLIIQLMQNLISNGMKYNQSSTPKIEVGFESKEDLWQFWVSDNGIGIPKEKTLEIFKPFTRLHGLADYPGTGLGLATCQKIVNRHGGKIWAESQKGQGTTFFFTLPKHIV